MKISEMLKDVVDSVFNAPLWAKLLLAWVVYQAYGDAILELVDRVLAV